MSSSLIRYTIEATSRILLAADQTRRFVGQIDGRRGAALCGWAFDRADPRQRLDVFVAVRPGVVQRFRADRHRVDLQGFAGSDGYCGFAVPVGDRDPGEPIHVLWGEARRDLPGSPWMASPVKVATRRVGNLLVAIERHGDNLAGWVSAPDEPHRRRMISLEVGGRAVGQSRACLYRTPPTGLGDDGWHGFCMALPSGERPIRLRDEATGAVIYAARR